MNPPLIRIHKEWLAACGVISEALRDFYRRGLFRGGFDADTMAEAIIARLARHDPPILLDMQEEEVTK